MDERSQHQAWILDKNLKICFQRWMKGPSTKLGFLECPDFGPTFRSFCDKVAPHFQNVPILDQYFTAFATKQLTISRMSQVRTNISQLLRQKQLPGSWSNVPESWNNVPGSWDNVPGSWNHHNHQKPMDFTKIVLRKIIIIITKEKTKFHYVILSRSHMFGAGKTSAAKIDPRFQGAKSSI